MMETTVLCKFENWVEGERTLIIAPSDSYSLIESFANTASNQAVAIDKPCNIIVEGQGKANSSQDRIAPIAINTPDGPLVPLELKTHCGTSQVKLVRVLTIRCPVYCM